MIIPAPRKSVLLVSTLLAANLACDVPPEGAAPQVDQGTLALAGPGAIPKEFELPLKPDFRKGLVRLTDTGARTQVRPFPNDRPPLPHLVEPYLDATDPDERGPGVRVVGVDVDSAEPFTMNALYLTYWRAGNRAGAQTIQVQGQRLWGHVAGRPDFMSVVPSSEDLGHCEGFYYYWTLEYTSIGFPKRVKETEPRFEMVDDPPSGNRPVEVTFLCYQPSPDE